MQEQKLNHESLAIMTCAAIIVAAGSGVRARRTSDAVAKQYVPLAGKAVLCRTIETFLTSDAIDLIVTVIAQEDLDLYKNAVAPLLQGKLAEQAQKKLRTSVRGGTTRQASVLCGLRALEKDSIDTVLVHDAARPFISHAILDRCRIALHSHKACLVAVPVTDTIKQATPEGRIQKTIDRSSLWAAQTPQAFAYDFIYDAHTRAAQQCAETFTDDAAVAEWAGAEVHIVEGDPTNIKLTNREDLDMADARLNSLQGSTSPLTDVRMGTGYDVHAFDAGDAVIIGGIQIPHDKKLKGHSDADVGLHAITDAILGAIADGDIGTHFPPSDPQWKGAASDLFLKDAVRRVRERNGKISNIDLTLICEAPKIGPHRPAMRQAIADICEISINRVSVKATTSERLGFTGRKEGIAAMASTCIQLPDRED
ncbi:bifunctional 2-C-methyl-D-erythritol 4-phosphate cytidylyltransferase/2-C-methyl-D-erythritol 2,4-cyclodiphosphate synthase [Cohaesibacter celericrescens]|uniref:bifunctional 2-C-methyl-D-erythritol 4-phosphate cytidylyltransferase/2-C-methyl-D-erythritol 2,4-cyclodiphosphate synthase n=1 Tax=Cohaesibacter celericrescens TaxID=2067669 RepID=UPI0035651DED